jgi:hypothetical protein
MDKHGASNMLVLIGPVIALAFLLGLALAS